ncbi:sigma-70 family RNA polymerase sigma factor [Fulvivirgaceae bacterium BMA12]|uniref:Sigma-70 family RNA polymerase sigma factor n=1 Tax=Agaribacillus aureus TaxID=3051825 RepID=A0ABT8L860_9BACT|nr:sigma-70 family RNA polymerase sigma factor [Fulvivirgaceae bacterium BMA12]
MTKDVNHRLRALIASCKRGNRRKQEELYLQFYNYALSICLRYSRDREEAIEIVNDGFVKIFTKLDKYTKNVSFKSWIRKIMVNTAIDYYRRHKEHYHHVDISYAKYEQVRHWDVLDKISEREIIGVIQLLPPSYRLVFNLYVIEGYKHEEVARKLNISIGTSKSNLAMARSKLKRMILKVCTERIAKVIQPGTAGNKQGPSASLPADNRIAKKTSMVKD